MFYGALRFANKRVHPKLCEPLLSDKINNGGFSYGKKEESLMRQLIEKCEITDFAGVQALVKKLTAGMIQESMGTELKATEYTRSMVSERLLKLYSITFLVLSDNDTAVKIKPTA
jgi:hypothetical protein